MTITFNRSVVGDRLAAFRNDRSRFNLANLFAGERNRIAEVDSEIDRRAYAFGAAPHDPAKQQMARRWLTNAAMIAETGSTQENSK
ncbi:glutaredoxin-like domain protein [Mycolicibacterium fortuitum subsp. acetamidolyticum]|uniref:Glutaredoxin-like domain protein n=1 Tax=Mycolicibacterium fortuitum subsp. acetamidolyticum TaxID=144550 RepID=A0A100WQV2_MYCFO|nr:hypothetical protein [Mycolicibacterium fortuitum]MCV7140375.1 hypothetical protein [Mycolicibacterium fortuitum]GAT02945.1 glutaredoxin-like domain protein [Mycolicibacterium fortuitum subsp. acetamidolyticum]